MFNLFKKKYQDMKSYSDIWTVATAKLDGKPLFIRFRAGLKEAIGHPDFPFQIGVATPFLKLNEHGLPEKEEMEELEIIEKEIEQKLKNVGEVVFSNVITHNGMREFVFYAQKWTPELFEKEVKTIKTKHDLQFMMKKDAEWTTFKNFSS